MGDAEYDAARLEEERVNRATTSSNSRAALAGHAPRAPKAKVAFFCSDFLVEILFLFTLCNSLPSGSSRFVVSLRVRFFCCRRFAFPSLTFLPFLVDDQQLVTFDVDNVQLLNSADAKVDATVSAPIPENGKSSAAIKIPALNFANTREYVAKDGVYVKYEFTEKGLSLAQQTNPF